MPGVGAGRWDGADRVRVVSRGELQGLKGTWLERRKRSRQLMGGPALAEGAKGPSGSWPTPDPEACGYREGFPFLCLVAAWSTLP